MKRLLHRVVQTIQSVLLWDNPFELFLDYHLLRRKDPIRILKHGASLVVNYRSSDMQAAKDVLLDGMYDNSLKSAFENIKAPRALKYLNLGANIGTFDIQAGLFASNYNLPAIGHAVEMNTATFARLVINLEINALLSICPINIALTGNDGELTCDFAMRDTGQSSSFPNSSSISPTEHLICSTSWTSLWKQIKPPFDIVKVDIEGAEVFFLTELTKEQADMISFIVIETHSSALHSLCDTRLSELGFLLVEKGKDNPGTRLSLWQSRYRAQL